MCHTPINALGGSSESQAFQGGLIPMQDWYAPSLTSNQGSRAWRLEHRRHRRPAAHRRVAARRGVRPDGRSRLRQPAIPDRRRHPRHGRVSEKPGPSGAAPAAGCRAAAGRKQPADDAWARRSTTAQCATCHGADGRGMPPHYPPLAGNQSIQMQSAVNPIRMVLNGGFPPGTAENPKPYGMPPFAQRLSDDRGRRGRHAISAPPGAITAPRYRRSEANDTAGGAAGLRQRMINSDPPTGSEPGEAAVQEAGRSGVPGAAGRSPASPPPIVIALWFAFYLLVFVPRAHRAMSQSAVATIDERHANGSNGAGRSLPPWWS